MPWAEKALELARDILTQPELADASVRLFSLRAVPSQQVYRYATLRLRMMIPTRPIRPTFRARTLSLSLSIYI